jgi:hypothetical protein
MIDIGAAYLIDVADQFRKQKQLAERALAQLPDEDLFARASEEENSAAILVKHIAGNLRSRWTDFLTTDGEKPDRNRDGEFETGAPDTRESLMRAWDAGWRLLFEQLGALAPEDLLRVVTVRGEPHTVIQAINRQLTHQTTHVGQIVLIAKARRGAAWQTLSIPRGESAAFNAAMAREADRRGRAGTAGG